MQGEATCVTPSGACKLTLINKKDKHRIQDFEKVLKEECIIEEEEFVSHILEEASFNDTIGEIEEVVDLSYPHHQHVISVNSVNMYAIIDEYHRGILMEEVEVNTKYKTVDRKIKPVAIPLPEDSWQKMKEVAKDPSLRNPNMIGHVFTDETKAKLRVGREDFLLHEEERMFRGMLERHGKAFAFFPQEIGCANPRTVEPMVIFTVPKKNGWLQFIQDLQPVNKVTIRNAGIGPSVDEFAEAFAGRSIYSIGDLYSGYDQFQLAVDSRDITTMRTPIGLVRMCTLPQGATNSVAHMVNAMNKVLKDCIPDITMPFLDDIPIKGCSDEEKDESKDKDGCRKFVMDHMKDCEKVLQRLEDANLTFSGEKSAFGQPEILVVGHMCGAYGRKPSPSKVNAIQDMKEECENQTDVRRFLGACAFYHIWLPPLHMSQILSTNF